MLQIRSELKYVILVYIIFSLLLLQFKPKIMFENNKIKPFGIGTHKTIFNYNISLIFISLIIFFIFEICWLKKNNLL